MQHSFLKSTSTYHRGQYTTKLNNIEFMIHVQVVLSDMLLIRRGGSFIGTSPEIHDATC